LCRRCTHRKLQHFKTFKISPEKSQNFVLWHFCRKCTICAPFFPPRFYCTVCKEPFNCQPSRIPPHTCTVAGIVKYILQLMQHKFQYYLPKRTLVFLTLNHLYQTHITLYLITSSSSTVLLHQDLLSTLFP
jgi:hypothetical protein